MDVRIVEGMEHIALDDVMALMAQTYWANTRPREQMERAARASRCFGAYVEGESRLAAFARIVTDGATMYYLCDVIVDEAHRGRGVGTALVGHVLDLPEIRDLKGHLVTYDAHALYRKFGFETLEGRYMAKKLGC